MRGSSAPSVMRRQLCRHYVLARAHHCETVPASVMPQPGELFLRDTGRMASRSDGWGRTVHVGLIGTGRIGALHARSLRQSPLVSTLTIFDADSDRGAQVAGDVGAELAESPQALVSGGVDAIVIAAATPAHAELLHMAAEASVPAFCEK